MEMYYWYLMQNDVNDAVSFISVGALDISEIKSVIDVLVFVHI